MKKLLLLFIMMLMPMVTLAEAVEIDGIYYNLIKKNHIAEVTRNPNNYTGDLVIPSTILYNDEIYDIKYIYNSAFYECSGLNSLIISEGIISIGDNAFGHCGIKSITLPKSLIEIGFDAFDNCYGLKEVHIVDLEAWCNINFKCSESDFFYNPYQSTPLYYAGHLYIGEDEITEISLPTTLKKVNHMTFMGASNITKIIFSDNIETIDWGAFYGCTRLSDISLPTGLQIIGTGAFMNCSNLETCFLPESLTKIGVAAFRDCSKLDTSIPSSVEYIGDWAFGNCLNLKDVTLPSYLTEIGEYCFQNCKSIDRIDIPNNVKRIDGRAFEGCSNLCSLSLGNNISVISACAFSSCQELKDVICYSDIVPNTSNQAFLNSYIESATLYVPSESVAAYSATEPWSSFKNIVGIDGSVVPKCSIPIISAKDGKLTFTCETEGVEYQVRYEYDGAKKTMKSNKLILSGTTTAHVTVYATKEGYLDSDTATADVELNVGKQGDTNGDGVVSITDAVGVVNIILNNGGSEAPTLEIEEQEAD